MTTFLNLALFFASGFFAIHFFQRADFYGIAGFMVSRSSLLYILGGIILITGGFIRAISFPMPAELTTPSVTAPASPAEPITQEPRRPW